MPCWIARFMPQQTSDSCWQANRPQPIATCWRAGATPSIDRINKYFTFSQMPVVSSDYWNGYLGAQDEFGTGVLKTLANNMAKMLEA